MSDCNDFNISRRGLITTLAASLAPALYPAIAQSARMDLNTPRISPFLSKNQLKTLGKLCSVIVPGYANSKSKYIHAQEYIDQTLRYHSETKEQRMISLFLNQIYSNYPELRIKDLHNLVANLKVTTHKPLLSNKLQAYQRIRQLAWQAYHELSN